MFLESKIVKNKIILEPKDLECFNESNIVGEGSYGKVFKYDKDNVIKLWNWRPDAKKFFKNVSPLCNVSYEFSNIILPKKMALKKEGILRPSKGIGYISKYFDGIPLKKVYDNLNYHKYVKALYQLEKDLNLFSQMTKYYIDDLHFFNILAKYDNDEVSLALIDCDDWTKGHRSLQEIKNENITKLTDSIISNFIYWSADLRSFINRDDTLRRSINTSFPSVADLHEFLNSVKTRIEDYANHEINTMEDFEKVLIRR